MSRYVTHVKRLRELAPSLELFYSRIEPLVRSGRLGPVLWQLPPTFCRDDDRLAEALAQLPEGRTPSSSGIRAGSRQVADLLRAHGVALVIADRPEIRAFQTHELTADFKATSAFMRPHAVAGATTPRPNWGNGPPASARGP